MLGILRVNLDGSPKTSKRTWGNHVIGRMWEDHLDSLFLYQEAVCYEWVHNRGYRDTCLLKTFIAINDHAESRHMTGQPWWLGDESVHLSHRSNLIRKLPEHYRPIFGDAVSDDLPYVWPRKTLTEEKI